MTAPDLSKGIGLLFHVEGEDWARFLGTCFAFRNKRTFLTAAHCVGNLEPKQLAIGLPRITHAGGFSVASIARHPTADLAVFRLNNEPPVNPIMGFASNFHLGEDYWAFGFPEDVLGPNAGQPTARIFKGYFQRYMHHKSYMGYSYNAGELSTPCPGGLSGGPVVRLGQNLVSGLVTENLQSRTVLESVEEIQSDRETVKTNNQSFVEYGVALLLDSHADWLDQNAPPIA